MNKVDNGNGLEMAYLDEGHGNDVILLLHGFPELAYSWRHVIPTLAQAGYRVIAPDQRGYGETTGCGLGCDDPTRCLPTVSLDECAFRYTND